MFLEFQRERWSQWTIEKTSCCKEAEPSYTIYISLPPFSTTSPWAHYRVSCPSIRRWLSCVTPSLFVARSFMAQDADATTACSPAVLTHVGVLWCGRCHSTSCTMTSSLSGIPLSLQEASYTMSSSWIDRRHVLRSVAVSCQCVVEMFDCLACLWVRPSSADVGGLQVLSLIVSKSPWFQVFAMNEDIISTRLPVYFERADVQHYGTIFTETDSVWVFHLERYISIRETFN